MAATTASGSVLPGWGNVAMGFVGLGWTGWDIYQLVKNWNEEEE